jgi:hypothetical protein
METLTGGFVPVVFDGTTRAYLTSFLAFALLVPEIAIGSR